MTSTIKCSSAVSDKLGNVLGESPELPDGWMVKEVYRLSNDKDYHCTLVNDKEEIIVTTNGCSFDNAIDNAIFKVRAQQ